METLEFEGEVRRTVEAVVDAFRSRFETAGLKIQFDGIFDSAMMLDGEQVPVREAEIRVYARDGDLVDSLPFFVTRNGKPAVEVAAVAAWLQPQLEQIVVDRST